MWRDWLRRALIGWGLVPKPDLAGAYLPDHPSPDDLTPGRLIVVRDGALTKWACFRCPGGCGERIQLSLNSARRPRWSVSLDWLRRPSLEPSVRQMNACRCHFWVRKGRVEWCGDSRHHEPRTGSPAPAMLDLRK